MFISGWQTNFCNNQEYTAGAYLVVALLNKIVDGFELKQRQRPWLAYSTKAAVRTRLPHCQDPPENDRRDHRPNYQRGCAGGERVDWRKQHHVLGSCNRIEARL